MTKDFIQIQNGDLICPHCKNKSDFSFFHIVVFKTKMDKNGEFEIEEEIYKNDYSIGYIKCETCYEEVYIEE